MSILTRTITLFPAFALPRLGRARGRKWARLVEHVAELPATHAEHMAYTLLMRRLSQRVGRGASDLCFEPGCVNCALDVLERYAGGEAELLAEYQAALGEVRAFLAGAQQMVAQRRARVG